MSSPFPLSFFFFFFFLSPVAISMRASVDSPELSFFFFFLFFFFPPLYIPSFRVND